MGKNGRSAWAVLVSLGILLAGASTVEADSILTCVFANGTATFYEDVLGRKPIEAGLDSKEKAWTVVFAGLDGNHPRLKGNLGEENLVVLGRTADAIWLVERPPLGGVNVWTVFLQRKTAILSKQYELMGGPLGLLSMGKCH